MIKRHEATLTMRYCDVPGCIAHHESFWLKDEERSEAPEGWTLVVINPDVSSVRHAAEQDLLLLCPKHTHLGDAVRLVQAVLNRETESHDAHHPG